MDLKVNIKGLTELKARLEALSSSVATKAGQSAVRAGAKVALSGIAAATPVSDVEEGALHRRIRKSGKASETEHHKIINSLKLKKIKTDAPTKVGAAVTTGQAFQARFVEWGTIHQKPNAFMERGLSDLQQEVVDAMAKQLEKQIIKGEKVSDDD